MSSFYSDGVNLGKINCIEELDDYFIDNMVSNLTATQRFFLRINGSLEIGHFRMAGWTKELPFYLFSCKEHGYQISYANGHYQNLICPKCIKAHELPIAQVTTNEIKVQPALIPQI